MRRLLTGFLPLCNNPDRVGLGSRVDPVKGDSHYEKH